LESFVYDQAIPPFARDYQPENTGTRRDALGTGKGAAETIGWVPDLINNAQYLPKNSPMVLRSVLDAARTSSSPALQAITPTNSAVNRVLGAIHNQVGVTPANQGKLGGLVGKVMTPNYIGNSMANSKPWMRTGANIGAGMATSVIANVGGEVVASGLDAGADKYKELMKSAQFYGDRDLQERLVKLINDGRTFAADSRTMGNAIGTGASIGPLGVKVAGAAGLGVVAARHATGGIKDVELSERAFYDQHKADMKRRIKSAFEKSGNQGVENDAFTPWEALEILSQKAQRVGDGDYDFDAFDEEHFEDLVNAKEYLDAMPRTPLDRNEIGNFYKAINAAYSKKGAKTKHPPLSEIKKMVEPSPVQGTRLGMDFAVRTY
jgi:hypothetical protein